MSAATNTLRRALLLSGLDRAGASAAPVALPASDPTQAHLGLIFPQDFGSHAASQTEWWYVTGHARSGVREWGFQVTFFRSRVKATQQMRSRFAAKQLLFAHAAVTDLQGGKLWHDQRIARWDGQLTSANTKDAPSHAASASSDGAAAVGNAWASSRDTAVRLGNWSLQRETGSNNKGATGASQYLARVSSAGFALRLTLTPTQPILLQGDAGVSRKGPGIEHSSRYYSEPQMQVQGQLTLAGQSFILDSPQSNGINQASVANASSRLPVGAAWLDHEWSDALLPPGASGWDWIGINLFDGSALMAFQIRSPAGKPLWDGGSHRALGQTMRVFAPGETSFMAVKRWTSATSRASYPVRWQVRTPVGQFTVQARLDDQELDSRRSTGAIYWEGLADLLDSAGVVVGRGYLEMTGYAAPLSL